MGSPKSHRTGSREARCSFLPPTFEVQMINPGSHPGCRAMSNCSVLLLDSLAKIWMAPPAIGGRFACKLKQSRAWSSIMTREELHALVWSQPMRTVAKSLGVSDVALAKRCRKANVPAPPRGWWARKEAGQPVVTPPLPRLPFAMDRFFSAIDRQAEARTKSRAETEQGNSCVVPGPPIFQDIAAVRRRARRES